jgi:hypothetical protein
VPQGSVATVGDLPDGISPNPPNTLGDAYTVQSFDPDHLFVWDGDSWEDMGVFQGPAGATGPTGATGPAGPTGATGPQGPAGSGIATTIVTVTGATRTLSSADHNKILDFTNATGCSVTVPLGLVSGISGTPFLCQLSKGTSAGNITVVAGAGAIVNAEGGLFVLTTSYGVMTLKEWPDGSFRLYGGTDVGVSEPGSPVFAWTRPTGLVPHTSGRSVFAWWHYFLRSFDNQPVASDIYTSFLNDAGFQSTTTYGAALRDRAISRTPIPPDEVLTFPLEYYVVKDMQFDCENAWDAGLDGFQLNIINLNDAAVGWGPASGKDLPNILEGARRATLNGKPIKIMIMLDGNILGSTTALQKADYVRKYMNHANVLKTATGQLVLGSFGPEFSSAGSASSVAHWTDVIARIGATVSGVPGLPVFFMPSFLNSTLCNDAGWKAICQGMGVWGGNVFSTQASLLALGKTVMDGGRQWMTTCFPQDYRPNTDGGTTHAYFEAGGSKLYRQSWDNAIAANVYNPALSRMVSIATWNDFSEHNHIMPCEPLKGIQTAYRDLTAYYAVKFKTGASPTIVRDQLALFHRKERTDTYPATGSSQPAATALIGTGLDAAQNNVEALAYLSSSADLEADRGDGTIGTVVTGTGLQVATVPVVTGQTPKARIKRSAVTVLSLTSDFAVRAASTYQDLQYKGTTGTPTAP